MAVVDIVDIVDQRLAQIEEDDADISAEETYFSGESGVWCLITLWDDEVDELLGFEFIETAESWKRLDAVLEYNEAASEEVDVVVIVPDESFVELAELLNRAGDPRITISDYSAMELQPRVLVA
jgi:hypothetical protein